MAGADAPANLAHETVLLNEAVDAVFSDPEGFYIDATFGRGGHSSLLVSRLGASGRLLMLDRDPQAIAVGKEKFSSEARAEVVQSEFSQLANIVDQKGVSGSVMGILFDLGVSSPQLDDPSRGFSFMQDGPLDMRMSKGAGESAADWLNRAGLEEIVRVLKDYGEERFARRIATAVIDRRAEQPLQTTRELVELIDAAVPVKDPHKHPATRSFQAIRIHVNAELAEVERALEESIRVLALGGRLAVISFHSLEDRIVKRFMRDHSKVAPLPKGLPVSQDQMATPPLRLIGKAIKPTREEIDTNPRSRSAILRVAEKVAEPVDRRAA